MIYSPSAQPDPAFFSVLLSLKGKKNMIISDNRIKHTAISMQAKRSDSGQIKVLKCVFNQKN